MARVTRINLDSATQQRQDSLSAIFSPRAIAVVGASDTVSKIGGIPVDFHKRFGFTGKIYPVNPKPGLVQGLQAYPSIQAIGAPVDLAIFAIPAHLVQAALQDAIAAGVRGVVLFSSGFAEANEEGGKAQAKLTEMARAGGIRLLGPNCLGFMNINSHVYATFTPAPNAGLVRPGPIGLVSQSGAFGAYAYSLARERGLGFSQWVTTGNESDIDFADCVEWLAHDPNTKVIMGYMEGCRDGFRLRRALAAAHAAKKPVIIVKVGRTELGAKAAASHTAALAGNDAVYDAIFREYGVHRARDITEFFSMAASASLATLPTDNSVGLFTLSGGVGVLMADEAGDAQLNVRPMPEPAQTTITTWVPFANPINPVDITGQVTNEPDLIERTARLMLEQGNYASWLGFLAAAGTSEKFWPVIETMARNLRRDFPDKLLALSTLLSQEKRQTLESLGCLVFVEPAEAVRAIAALGRFSASFSRTCPPALPLSAVTQRLPAGTLTEPQGLAVLKAAGIQTAAHQVVHSADEAVQAAQTFGTPVALKIVSPDITHKSDAGGVMLGLQGEEAVRHAYAQILQQVRAHSPNAAIHGVLVMPMLARGVECILGVHRDPVFGPMVMFGLGGIFVELLGDVSIRSAPVSEATALEMISQTKGYALLTGARGQEPVDLPCLARNLSALSQLAVASGDSLHSIDINPFIALPARLGGGCAADAVVVGQNT